MYNPRDKQKAYMHNPDLDDTESIRDDQDFPYSHLFLGVWSRVLLNCAHCKAEKFLHELSILLEESSG